MASTFATPQISVQTLALHLPDPAVPPFLAALTIAKGSLIINVGPQPAAPFAIANDSAVAIPVSHYPPGVRSGQTCADTPGD